MNLQKLWSLKSIENESKNQKLLNLLTPCLLNGIETANPSGKFWIPIPIANAIAEPIVNTEASPNPNNSGEAKAPKATPTAKPSGMLCNAIASTNKPVWK